MRLRRKPAAGREPHPDPRKEASLQRVIALRRLAGRKQDALDSMYEQVTRARRDALNATGSSHQRYMEFAAELQDSDIPRTEDEVLALQEQVAKAVEGIDEDDLAWLEPRPDRGTPRNRKD